MQLMVHQEATELKPPFLTGRTALPIGLSTAWTSLSSTSTEAGFSTLFRSDTGVPVEVRNVGKVKGQLSSPLVSLQK